MREPPTALALLAGQVVAAAAARGAHPPDVLAAAGLSPADIADPESAIAIDALYRLWEAALRATQSPALPIDVARASTLSDLRLYGFLIMTSGTGRQAIERAIRFASLLSSSGRWELVTDAACARVVWIRADPLTLGVRVSNESAVSIFLHGFRESTSWSVPVLDVTFRHPAPEASEHEAFFGCPIHWGAAMDSFSFGLEGLELVPKDANPALAAFLSEEAESRLPFAAEPRSFLQRVMGTISDSLADGPPQLEVCARGLSMSARTLNRRLADDGTSFSKLVEQVRREKAERLLVVSRSVTEVAFALGYSDGSAFSRAFRRWTGQSPAEFKAQLPT